MAADGAAAESWTAWEVKPQSGFQVAGAGGRVGLLQISDKNFLVTDSFRFDDDHFVGDIQRRLAEHIDDPEEAERRINAARTFVPREESPTDLASIPQFMRWFENPYGPHTLAAIIHDELITEAPNEGALGSDTLSDRFFRHMLQASEVPWLKRWVIWAAVALRTRWAAKGLRRASLLLWTLLAAIGNASIPAAIVVLADDGFSGTFWLLAALAVVLPFPAAALWGSQWGAGLVSALVGFFVIPVGFFVLIGTLVYRLMERAAGWSGRK